MLSVLAKHLASVAVIALHSDGVDVEFLEEGLNEFEGQADDVGETAVDAEDEPVDALFLDGVGAGLALPGPGGDVDVNIGGRHGFHDDTGRIGLDPFVPVGGIDEGDAGDDLVRRSGEGVEDSACVVGIGGFSDDLAGAGDEGVGPEDDGGNAHSPGDVAGLGQGQGPGGVVRIGVRGRRFVDIGGYHVKDVSGVGE